MKHGAGAGLIALALLWAPAAVATNSLLELRVQELRSEGDVSVGATFAALLIEKDASVPEIQIKADSLHLETDTNDPGAHTGVVGQLGSNGVTSTSTPSEYGISTVRLLAARDGHRLNLYGKGASLDASLACAKTEPSDAPSLQREPWAYGRNPVVVNLDDTLRITSCGRDYSITIRGDILISAWEADLELVADDKQTVLESGRLATKYAPNGTDPRPYVSRDQELYLYFHGAVVTVSHLPAPVYAQNPKTIAGGVTKLGAAEGSIDLATETTTLHGAALTLRGNLDIDAKSGGAQRPFSLTARGDLDAATIDGQSVAVAPASAAFPWMLVWIGGLLTVIAVAIYERPLRWYKQHLRSKRRGPNDLPIGHRQKRAVGYWSRGIDAFNDLRMGKAKRLAAKAIRLFPDSIDTQALHALMILRMGDPAHALPYFERIHPQMPGGAEKSQAACCAAEAALFCKRPGEALRWLHVAHRDHYRTFLNFIARPEFDDLQDDEWFAAMQALARDEPPPRPRKDAGIA